MKTEQCQWVAKQGWDHAPGALPDAQFLLVFAQTDVLRERHALIEELRDKYPRAEILGCSTAGEIRSVNVTDETLTMTAVRFEHTAVRSASEPIPSAGASYEVGEHLSRKLLGPELAHVFVLSDGLLVNGSDLVRGLTAHLPDGVTVTGGLSGDGSRFQETLVLVGGKVRTGTVAAVGFYGCHLQVGYASLGGWDSFGPERLITRSEGNILFELDGQSALALYKQYLGEHAEGLPSTGLLYPLQVRLGGGEPLVRTILAVDEAQQSMTFAGDMPEGGYARLMKANFDRLVDGAAGAARGSCDPSGEKRPDLAILISCVGRKLVLQQRVEEEVEAVRDVFGPSAMLTGFYSYGEISPFTSSTRCELHNQTMTITTLREDEQRRAA